MKNLTSKQMVEPSIWSHMFKERIAFNELRLLKMSIATNTKFFPMNFNCLKYLASKVYCLKRFAF